MPEFSSKKIKNTSLQEQLAGRYAAYDVPFWVTPNTFSGRWNRPNSIPTQYLSLNPETMWAELIRHESLKTVEELSYVNIPIWVCKLNESNLVDLSSIEKAQSYGLSPSDLVGENYSPCQELADLFVKNGYRGVIYPSAAIEGGKNVALFGQRLMWSSDSRPLFPSAISIYKIGQAKPPPEILEKVIHFEQTTT